MVISYIFVRIDLMLVVFNVHLRQVLSASSDHSFFLIDRPTAYWKMDQFGNWRYIIMIDFTLFNRLMSCAFQ